MSTSAWSIRSFFTFGQANSQATNQAINHPKKLTNDEQLAEAERRVMARVRMPYEQSLVPINEQGHVINTVHFKRPDNQTNRQSVTQSDNQSTASSINQSNNQSNNDESPLVLIHGFGAGLALYCASLDELARSHQSVYAIDLLGCGRSSRPPFKLIDHPLDETVDESVDEATGQSIKQALAAESFFVDSLERWRASLGIERMSLAGHSLGGYLSSAYALRYPERVDRLILISPVGIPNSPTNQENVRNMSNRSFPVRALFSTLQTLWSAGLAPQDVVKLTGGYGRSMIDNYVMKRFTRQGPNMIYQSNDESDEQSINQSIKQSTDQGGESNEGAALAMGSDVDVSDASSIDKPAFADYIHRMFLQPASGERGLRYLLTTSAHARYPLIDRLPKLATLNPNIRVTSIYGTHDWMDVKAGTDLTNRLIGKGMKAQCIQVIDAGHQVFIDNTFGFVQAMKKAYTFDQSNNQSISQSNNQDDDSQIVTLASSSEAQ